MYLLQIKLLCNYAVGSLGLWHYVLLLILYYRSLELISMATAVTTITTTRKAGDMREGEATSSLARSPSYLCVTEGRGWLKLES